MYSKEQVQKIRDLISSHFEKGDVYDKLKKKISTEGLTIDQLTNEQLTKLLQETNLIDNLMLDIKHLDEIALFNEQNKRLHMINTTNKRQMTLRIYRGRAFLDFVRDTKFQFLQIYLSFCGQRYYSQRIPAENEPEFNELFVFDLSAKADLLALSKLEHPIEMALILINERDEIRKLYSQKLIEWRFLLCFGNISLNIEMPSLPSQSVKEPRTSVGLLQIVLELLPKTGMTLVPEKVLTQQLSQEKTINSNLADKFHTYSQAWWNDFKELDLSVRPIKLYAESQDGVWRPSCTFITELCNVRGISSPSHAARFVSLIPFKREFNSNEDRREVWHRFNTFLARRQGDFEDHCILLCSLLLGFGLEAYVVIGGSSDGAHGWVMTRQNKSTYHFYESLTGHRFEVNDPKVLQMYKKIGCVFNHKYFYANIQKVDNLVGTDLNLEDYTKWKAIDPDEISILKRQNYDLILTNSTIQKAEIERELELELKSKVSAYRKVLNQMTRYDEKLGSIMQIALSNYELEKITGQTFNQKEFQAALKGYIPEGHVFKSFPIQFLHNDTDKMLEAIKLAPVGGEILTARGDQIHFALKVNLELFPEDIYAVWVSLSVRYHQII